MSCIATLFFGRWLSRQGGCTRKQRRSHPKVAAVVAPSREKALKEGRLILVAEDNEINQKVIRQQLALLGYAADIAQDGREALKRWESGIYALLLTDLHMPEMDGYQLTAAIRLAEQGKGKARAPIIAFTANALKGEAEHCRAVGMDDYLSKPVQLAHLNAILQKWLPASLIHNRRQPFLRSLSQPCGQPLYPAAARSHSHPCPCTCVPKKKSQWK